MPDNAREIPEMFLKAGLDMPVRYLSVICMIDQKYFWPEHADQKYFQPTGTRDQSCWYPRSLIPKGIRSKTKTFQLYYVQLLSV